MSDDIRQSPRYLRARRLQLEALLDAIIERGDHLATHADVPRVEARANSFSAWGLDQALLHAEQAHDALRSLSGDLRMLRDAPRPASEEARAEGAVQIEARDG